MSTTTPVAQFSSFNGIDFNSIVTALMQQDSVPLTNLQTQLSGYQAQGSALSQLGSYINQMESDAIGLTDPTLFSDVKASSSDTTTLNATSTGSASSTGSYDVNITALARAQVTASTSGFASSSTTVADGGSLSFTINGTATTPINVAATTTLSQLQTLINNQNSGVTASIVNNGSTNLLVISGSQTGASTGFTINNNLTNSTGGTVTFAAGQNATTGNMQNAQDAAVNVNGIAITSATNTVTGAIPGVSLSLTKTGEASVNVVPDYSEAEAAITAIVNDYNSVQTFYGQEETTDSNGNPMPLDNDPAMRQAMRSLQNLFSESISGDPSGLTNLAQIGIEFNENGQLSFDQSTFESEAATNPSAVQTFLQGTDGTGGMMSTLQSTLHSLDPVDGLINTEIQSILQSENATQSQIQSEQVRLNEEQQALQAKFDAADNLMTQLNSMQGAISALSSSTSSSSSSSSSSSKNLTSSVN